MMAVTGFARSLNCIDSTGFIYNSKAAFCRHSSIIKAAQKEEEIDNEDWMPKDNSIPDKETRSWETELHFQINKLVLEDQWKKGFLKSKPRFLSYEGAKNWVQAQNMWTSKEEWVSSIEMGEGKPSLVPSDPEIVYKDRGTWVSWDDFLGV